MLALDSISARHPPSETKHAAYGRHLSINSPVTFRRPQRSFDSLPVLQMKRRRIGILGYEGVADVGFVGPLQAFSNAYAQSGSSSARQCYEVISVGLTEKPFTTQAGLVLQARHTLKTVPPLDTVILPGGSGLRESAISGPIAKWISGRSASTRRIASVSTGIYGIAPTGLLDDRRVTTHWRFVRDVARRFPQLQVEENALFLQDGKFYTSAGGTAGIDLSLALIAQDFGDEVALGVARDLLVYLRRDGGQEQYAEPTDVELPGAGQLGPLARWIDAHLADDLRLENLAKRVRLGKLQFIREFKSTFGVTPALFIKTRRLNEARRRLLAGENTAHVARAVGFRSTLYFAQEFKWRFGTAPDEFQSRFRFAGSSRNSATPDLVQSRASDALTGRRWERRRLVPATAVATRGERSRRADLVLAAA